MKHLLTFLLLSILFPFAVHAQIYQWVDENGIKHFSESPKGTADDAYPVKSKNNKTVITKPIDEKPVKVKQEINKKSEPDESKAKGWTSCDSELCEKVKKLDADCSTNDCTQAVKFTNDCKTILCLSEKIDFENRIDGVLKARQQSDNPQKVEEPVKEEKQKLSDKEVLEKCKEERNVKCRKNLEYYRVIYNGTSEERKNAWNELRNARSLRHKKKDQ